MLMVGWKISPILQLAEEVMGVLLTKMRMVQRYSKSQTMFLVLVSFQLALKDELRYVIFIIFLVAKVTQIYFHF